MIWLQRLKSYLTSCMLLDYLHARLGVTFTATFFKKKGLGGNLGILSSAIRTILFVSRSMTFTIHKIFYVSEILLKNIRTLMSAS